MRDVAVIDDVDAACQRERRSQILLHKYDRLSGVGEVTVATGDYLLGDRDGVVIVPREAAPEAITRTEEVMATESDMRAALLGGMDPVAAYERYGKF